MKEKKKIRVSRDPRGPGPAGGLRVAGRDISDASAVGKKIVVFCSSDISKGKKKSFSECLESFAGATAPRARHSESNVRSLARGSSAQLARAPCVQFLRQSASVGYRSVPLEALPSIISRSFGAQRTVLVYSPGAQPVSSVHTTYPDSDYPEIWGGIQLGA